ncbi:MAG TPA: PAS domain S-box protein, partial [Spirochaetota bacterium]|nr:PAS domain S-box protein [Spirochaetota bacterium]
MKNSPKTILLVEDEALVGIAESQALTTEGYEVIHVLSGEEAISFFREKMGTADLILMDVDLGEGIDGTVAAQEILRDNDIPVVFLSSHTEKEILEKTEKITSYGYVVKNTGITVLTASIKMAAKLHEAHRRLKEDERIIRESEKRYRATFETTGSATVVLREDTIISFANREFERLSGYSKEEIEGKMSWTEWVVKDDLNIMMERHRKRREEGKEIPREYEFRFVKKSSEVRNILLHVDMVPGTTESIASLVDITDLRASEERYRKLAENAGESIV